MNDGLAISLASAMAVDADPVAQRDAAERLAQRTMWVTNDVRRAAWCRCPPWRSADAADAQQLAGVDAGRIGQVVAPRQALDAVMVATRDPRQRLAVGDAVPGDRRRCAFALPPAWWG